MRFSSRSLARALVILLLVGAGLFLILGQESSSQFHQTNATMTSQGLMVSGNATIATDGLMAEFPLGKHDVTAAIGDSSIDAVSVLLPTHSYAKYDKVVFGSSGKLNITATSLSLVVVQSFNQSISLSESERQFQLTSTGSVGGHPQFSALFKTDTGDPILLSLPQGNQLLLTMDLRSSNGTLRITGAQNFELPITNGTLLVMKVTVPVNRSYQIIVSGKYNQFTMDNWRSTDMSCTLMVTIHGTSRENGGCNVYENFVQGKIGIDAKSTDFPGSEDVNFSGYWGQIHAVPSTGGSVIVTVFGNAGSVYQVIQQKKLDLTQSSPLQLISPSPSFVPWLFWGVAIVMAASAYKKLKLISMTSLSALIAITLLGPLLWEADNGDPTIASLIGSFMIFLAGFALNSLRHSK